MTIEPQTQSTGSTSGGSTSERPELAGLVVACGDSPSATAIADMQQDGESWRVQLIEGLCRNSDAITDDDSPKHADRMIVALCRGEYSKTEVLARARRAGIETFGTQIVEVPSASQQHANRAAAVTAVRGAIARAKALGAVSPENIKTSFSGNNGKISRRALFTIPPIEYRPVPTIDRSLCIAAAGCSQCEKACPHDAIKNVAGAVKVDAAVCSSCGICVGACPQRAVEFPGFSPAEIESHVEGVVNGDTGEPRNIAFACSKSSELPIEDWQIVPVACAAMVPASALLSAVASGARSVGILRCVDECAQRSGEKIEGRIDYARQVLKQVGGDRNRVVSLAAADSGVVQALPVISEIAPLPEDELSVEIYGHTAASKAVIAVAAGATKPVESFVHPFSPIGLPVVSSESCTMCGTCAAVCPTGALTQADSDGLATLSMDVAKCVACNECVANCPEIANGAIELELRTDVTALASGPVELNNDQLVSCDKCEKPFTSERTLSRLEALLGDDYSYESYGALCPECRTLGL